MARTLRGSLIGLTVMSQLGVAQQTSSYQLNGQEMVFLLLLVAFVLGSWVSYEWIRRGRST